MTTSPVVSVTDELIAELESVAHSNDADCMEVHGISVGIVRSLLAERAELKRGADNYRKLREGANWRAVFASSDDAEPLRGLDLDTAMQS